MTIAVQEAFEDRCQEEEDSESEIFQNANSEDEENCSKPFMIRFFSFFGSLRKQKEINTKSNDEIQRYFRHFFLSHFRKWHIFGKWLFRRSLIEIFSIITIREKHFESAYKLFVENKTGFPHEP